MPNRRFNKQVSQPLKKGGRVTKRTGAAKRGFGRAFIKGGKK